MNLVPRIEMAALLDVLNEYGHLPRAAVDNPDRPPPDPADVLGEQTARFPGLNTAALVDIADEAYEVFAAAQAETDAPGVLNTMLSRSRPVPRLVDGEIGWGVEDADQLLRAAVAVTLLEWLRERGQQRMGVCGWSRCADVFIDASPAGKRRFCGLRCLNKHKVAAFRERARG